ncbi:MAG: hypothetical protein LQ349_009594, partial [Xanthoria aureola]
PSTPAKIERHIPQKHLTTPQKSKVKTLKRQGFSATEIWKETGVKKRQQNQVNASISLRTTPRKRHRRGKINDDTIQKIIKALEGHYNRRTWSWEELRKHFRLDCTEATVKKTINNAGYHKCRACQKSWINKDQKGKRYRWACAYKKWILWQWKQ